MKAGRFLTIIITVLLLLGAGGMYWAVTLPHEGISHHLVRDLGIAFFISGLVTAAYEAYIRQRIDLEKIESVLATVAGSNLPAKVWDDIKRKLLAREVMRKEAEIRLSVRSDSALGTARYLIDYELVYDLVSLQSQDDDVVIRHVLDDHVDEAALNVPRFDRVEIGSSVYLINARDSWTSNDKKLSLAAGRLEIYIRLLAAGASPVRISVRRTEIRHCPGIYHLVFTELTDGITVSLDHLSHEVQLRLLLPNEPEVELSPARPLVVSSSMILPGHAAELRLRPATPGAVATENISRLDS